LELVTLEIWRKLFLEPEILVRRQIPYGQWRAIIAGIFIDISLFFNSPKFKIKSLEMKKIARSEGTNNTNC
jgi:hypothetical protein